MSNFAKKVQKWYNDGIWTAEMVRDAVEKGKLTAEEAQIILGDE